MGTNKHLCEANVSNKLEYVVVLGADILYIGAKECQEFERKRVKRVVVVVVVVGVMVFKSD